MNPVVCTGLCKWLCAVQPYCLLSNIYHSLTSILLIGWWLPSSNPSLWIIMALISHMNLLIGARTIRSFYILFLHYYTTHFLQPLNGKPFQQYKHYHGEAVNNTVRDLYSSFEKWEFLEKLPGI